MQILLVEDNAMNQKIALVMLKELGYEADLAETGPQALEKLEETQYDLILMDVELPEMDGLEVTQRIRQGDERHKAVPIIAMTAHVLSTDIERCLHTGMNDIITKPFMRPQLHAIIRRWSS